MSKNNAAASAGQVKKRDEKAQGKREEQAAKALKEMQTMKDEKETAPSS